MLKKHLFWNMFFSSIFFDFAWILDPQNNHFWTKFGNKMQNVNFVKIVLPCRREHEFQGFEGSKINKKLEKIRSKNEAKKWWGQISKKIKILNPKASQVGPKIL